jgi:hypothetical protein
LYCYRSRRDSAYRVMHCLVGTFIKEMDQEPCPTSNKTFYPIKIMLPPNKSRIFYFESSLIQKKWMSQIKEAIGYTNLFDFYDMKTNLGKGQFGLVKLATHKKTGQ